MKEKLKQLIEDQKKFNEEFETENELTEKYIEGKADAYNYVLEIIEILEK